MYNNKSNPKNQAVNQSQFKKPTQADWLKVWPLKQVGNELKGACPLCGGEDRFYIKPDSSFNCRQCDSDFKAVLKAAGFWQNKSENYQPPKPTEYKWTITGTKGTTYKAVRIENTVTGKKIGNWIEPKGIKLKPGELWNPYQGEGIGEADTLLIVEGEKKVDIVNRILPKNIRAIYPIRAIPKNDYGLVKDKTIILNPDMDSAGFDKARQIYKLVMKAGAKSVWIIQLPGLGLKDDVVDFIQNGGNLANQINQARPVEGKGDIKPVIPILDSGLKRAFDFLGVEVRYNRGNRKPEAYFTNDLKDKGYKGKKIETNKWIEVPTE